MMTSRGGSPSSATPEEKKAKKWQRAKEARHHLLQLWKMQKMTTS
jgi:hypothetical protein